VAIGVLIVRAALLDPPRVSHFLGRTTGTPLMQRCSTVDRFFAMYQAMYPDIYFTTQNVGTNGNVWIENDSDVDVDTALLPFRKATGEYWTTSDVRSTTTFNYAYVDTFKPHNVSDTEHIDAVKATVARLYGSSARAMLTAQLASAGSECLSTGVSNFTDWTIRASTLTSGPPAFVVHFRLRGNGPGQSGRVDVGTLMKLMSMSHDTTPRPDPIPKESYEGSVSLTATLVDQITDGRLRSLNEADVITFLNEYLDATITTVCSHFAIINVS
jgi:tyrosinase